MKLCKNMLKWKMSRKCNCLGSGFRVLAFWWQVNVDEELLLKLQLYFWLVISVSLQTIAVMDTDEECSIVLELPETDPFFDKKKVKIRLLAFVLFCWGVSNMSKIRWETAGNCSINMCKI